MSIKWLIFSCDLLSLYPAEHFLSMWLSGIMAIMNSNGDRASHWIILLWIFASAKLLPRTVNSALQIFMVFSIKFMTWCDILYILSQFNIRLCGTISYTFYYYYYYYYYKVLAISFSGFLQMNFYPYLHRIYSWTELVLRTNIEIMDFNSNQMTLY